MPDRRRRRIQFVSDALVQEIVDGIKTASVVDLGTATDILQGLVSRRDAEALEVTQLQHEVFQ